MTYAILNEIDTKKNFRLLHAINELAKVQEKHSELLNKIDPDRLAIVKIVPVTVIVTYDTTDQGLVANFKVSL